MNEITPPKLMPPDQGTLASGIVAAGTGERGRADQRPDDGVFNQAQRTGFMGDK